MIDAKSWYLFSFCDLFHGLNKKKYVKYRISDMHAQISAFLSVGYIVFLNKNQHIYWSDNIYCIENFFPVRKTLSMIRYGIYLAKMIVNRYITDQKKDETI